MLSAANVLTSSFKISHVNKRDIFQLNWLGSDQWIWKGCCDADFKSVWTRLPCFLSKDHLKREFLGIFLTTFSESVISDLKIYETHLFFSKRSKFNLNFKNEAKNSEKASCFGDNCIWIGIVKLSLLRTSYLQSISNVLTSRPKIRHVNKRDPFQLIWLGSDHGIQ